MSLFEKLGANNEAEAIVLVEQFNKFTASLTELTGQKDTASILGTVTAWKQSSITDSKRNESEQAHVAATLASLAVDKIGDCEKLKETYASNGFAAFIGDVEKLKNDHDEACAIIGNLVSGGRLAPGARSAFDDLFASNGIAALKAAAAALPTSPQINPGPAPEVATDDGLTESERARADNIKDPEQRKRFTAIRVALRAKKGSN